MHNSAMNTPDNIAARRIFTCKKKERAECVVEGGGRGGGRDVQLSRWNA
jgi:hypothetical protein